MEIKNYCMVALGTVKGVKDIISKISETPVRCIEHTNVFIATFSCVMSANELGDVFDIEKRTYFIFEIGNDSNTYKIGKKDIHQQLFGHIENGGNDLLNVMTNNLINELNGSGAQISGTTNTQQESLPLEEQLSIAIEEENYTKAAELRDIIKLKTDKD